jgi:DNA-binding HxlR family transcriptional regulator
MLDHWWDSEDMPFPAMKRLAKWMGVSKKTIQRALARLVSEGRIRRTARRNRHGDQTSNFYGLTPLVEKLAPIAEDILKAREEAMATRRSAERTGHRIRVARKAKS